MRCVMIGSFVGLLCLSRVVAADFPRFESQEIDLHAGEVCYAVTATDVNGDGKLDVVVVPKMR